MSNTTLKAVKDFNNIDPFERPFEHPNGVPLRFNYWQSNSFLEIKEIQDLIPSILMGDDLDCIKLSNNENQNNKNKNNIEKIIVLIAQNTDSDNLTNERIKKSLFFSKCSSFPINHLTRSDINSQITRQPSTETLYTTLLWPEKSQIDFDYMKNFSTKELFQNFTLTFQVNFYLLIHMLYVKL